MHPWLHITDDPLFINDIDRPLDTLIVPQCPIDHGDLSFRVAEKRKSKLKLLPITSLSLNRSTIDSEYQSIDRFERFCIISKR